MFIDMKESRAAKYGRFLAAWVDWSVQKIPEHQRECYKSRLMNEIKTFSFKPRRKGESVNEGCKWELEEIIELSVENPESLGRMVKEGIHLMYQKGTARIVMNTLLEYIK